MEREELEDGQQTAPSEVWGQMSAEQREHVLHLLTRIACEYVEANLEGGEENQGTESADDEQ